MERIEAKNLKKEILDDILNKSESTKFNTGLQCKEENLYRQPPGNRLSVGYSVDENGNYRVELIVFNKNGKAHLAAQKIQKKEGVENINIQVLNNFQSGRVPCGNGDNEYTQFRNHKRPLHLGLSISHKDGSSGTLGCFLKGRNSKGVNEEYILSCNHVMAQSGRAKIKAEDNWIFQPGYEDSGGRLIAGRRIAKLTEYAELFYSRRNMSDSAIATLESDIEHLGNIIPTDYGFEFEGEQIYLLNDEGDELPPRGAVVYKIGRTTGLTKGKIKSLSVDNIGIGGEEDRILVFDNVIQVDWQSSTDPFSCAGDSGSLAFTRINNKFYALGLIFAGGKYELNGAEHGASFICTIKDILKNYDGVEYIE